MSQSQPEPRGDKQEYKVKLDLFEGPLDLLLYLVTKSEVDIVDISVAQITRQYLEYLDVMRELNIDLASEYLSMAATLLRLKAQELLPQDEAEPLDEHDDIYSRRQLIEKLLEYKKFREAANSLRVYEAEQYGSFPRGTAEELEPNYDGDGDELGDVSIFDLFSALKRVLERTTDEEPSVPRWIHAADVKLDDRLEHVIAMLEEVDELPFDQLFADDLRRLVVVVTFMALLELVHMKRVRFRQEESMGTIYLSKVRDKLDRAGDRIAGENT